MFPYRNCAKLFRSSALKNELTFLFRKNQKTGIYQQPQNIVNCFCAEHRVPLPFRFVPQKVKIWN